MKTVIMMTRQGAASRLLSLLKALGIKAEGTRIAETAPDGLQLRPAITLPLEIYTVKRIREFDESEEELARVLRRPLQPLIEGGTPHRKPPAEAGGMTRRDHERHG